MGTDFSRRTFLGAGASGALVLGSPMQATAEVSRAREPHWRSNATSLTVNGQAYALAVDSCVALLDALRERIGILASTLTSKSTPSPYSEVVVGASSPRQRAASSRRSVIA